MKASVLPPEASEAGAAPSEEEPCRVSSIMQATTGTQAAIWLLRGIHMSDGFQWLHKRENQHMVEFISKLWLHIKTASKRTWAEFQVDWMRGVCECFNREEGHATSHLRWCSRDLLSKLSFPHRTVQDQIWIRGNHIIHWSSATQLLHPASTY